MERFYTQFRGVDVGVWGKIHHM